MDYYQILGLAETADAEAVKKAYRRLAKECHPDTHPGDRKAEERFKQISQAYAVLSDAERRKKYDRERAGADFFSYMGEKSGQSRSTQKQETGKQKQETKRNPIDTSGLFERYMGFK